MILQFDDLGGRFSAARYFLYRTGAAFGRFSSFREIATARVDRLIFVCSGNICRSPYAEQKVRLHGVQAASCGTTAIDGAPANETAIRVAAERGVDLTAHLSTRIQRLNFQPGDLAIGLEPAHLQVLAPLVTRAGGQATLLGLWCATRSPYIPDPYAKADTCFREVFRLVDEALANLLNELQSERHTQTASMR